MLYKRIFLLLFLHVFFTNAGLVDNEWMRFKIKFNRTYRNSDEDFKRFEIFKENLKFIMKHNENSAKNFKIEINRFSDLNDIELKVPESLKPR